MLSIIKSAAVNGINSTIVNVEVDLSNGIPSFNMTGYLGERVRESENRVKTALKNIGHPIPSSKIVINVSPASVRKSGTMLDLPIAVGILNCLGIIHCPVDKLNKLVIAGELSLDGSVNAIRGVLSIVSAAIDSNEVLACVVPKENLNEACSFHNMNIIGVGTLSELIRFLNEEDYEPEKCKYNPYSSFETSSAGESEIKDDFLDVKGQSLAKRAILIAACGRHSLLMYGPPGTGKTLLASRIPAILPELTDEESLEITKIYSVAGMLPKDVGRITKRQFRAPHHSISDAGLLGGGLIPMPGEISFAHKSVLFLDELTLFRAQTLELLRKPIEDGMINLVRCGQTYTFPADFMLVAAMNPCPCGFYPDRAKCRCTDYDIAKYYGKLSAPLLDRFDMSVCVERPKYEDVSGMIGNMEDENHKEKSSDKKYRLKTIKNNSGFIYSTDAMKNVVNKVTDIQKERYLGERIKYNSELNAGQIKKYCKLDSDAIKILEQLYKSSNLSVRSHNKIIKVARTIADIEESDIITKSHISEAICFKLSINV